MQQITPQPETASSGFLCDFIEERTIRPTDGLNGWCTIHYGNQYSKYTMSVKIENGYRKGKAIILNDGVPFITLFYQDGVLTGVVEKMNEYGMVALHGHLVNGIESGLFEEYDKNGKVVWRGSYRNGKRFQDVRGKIVKKGDDEEKSRETEEYYELDENGAITKFCIYEKGVLSRVVMEFNGDEMTEFDRNGRRVYEGGFAGDMKTGFVRDGKGREYGNGEVAIYAGEWRNGKREGLGTEFKGLSPLYSGEWKDGKRHGNGRELDKNGNVVKSGRWRDGTHESRIKIVVTPSSLTSDPTGVEKLVIPDSGFNISNITALKLSNLLLLRRVVIGDDCFGAVRKVEFCGLSVLEEIVIGKRSLTETRRIDPRRHYSAQRKGSFRIVDCVSLATVQIGDSSLSDFTSFEINNLPSLRSIEVGKCCFFFVSFFLLVDLPQLQSVKCDDGAFHEFQLAVFQNLPKLESIELGSDAFSGDNSERRRKENGYASNNTLVMKNLPSLTSFKCGSGVFAHICSVILENVPVKSSSGIHFDENCFYYSRFIEVSSTYCIAHFTRRSRPRICNEGQGWGCKNHPCPEVL